MRGPFDTENAITRQRSDISRAYTAFTNSLLLALPEKSRLAFARIDAFTVGVAQGYLISLPPITAITFDHLINLLVRIVRDS